MIKLPTIQDALRSALAARAQPAAEPVAWMNVKYGTFFGAGVIAQTDRNDDLIASGELIRLYAHPAQPAAEPASQRLTDEQIEEIFQEATGADEGTALRFARAIEAAHGIGKETP